MNLDFRVIGGLAHFMLILNVTNMDGNPFLNFLYQGIVELPALFLGKWTTNTLGRKWTAVAAFGCATISSLPLLFTSVGKLKNQKILICVL